MAYTYTNGDGLAALTATEPANTDQIATSCAQSIRQIKAFLKDPTTTVAPYSKSATDAAIAAAIAAIPSPGSFNANPGTDDAVNQTETCDGTAKLVTDISYVAPANGTYFMSGLFQFDNVSGVVAGMQVLCAPTINGSYGGQGGASAVASPPGDRWFVAFSRLVTLTAGQTLGLSFEAYDGVGTGQIKLSAVHLSAFRLST